MRLKNERDIGARIALLRTKKKLSQTELAELSGVSQRTISLLENGKSGTIGSLVKVLRALKVEMELKDIVQEIDYSDFLE